MRKYIVRNMIRILKKSFKTYPAVYIYYYITVNNEEYENFLKNNPKDIDPNVDMSNNEDIERIVSYAINHFRNSRGYNKNGISNVLISKCVTINDISYDYIKNIIKYPYKIGKFNKFIYDKNTIKKQYIF